MSSDLLALLWIIMKLAEKNWVLFLARFSSVSSHRAHAHGRRSMAYIPIQHIVSFSSETPGFEAANIINSKSTSSWRGKAGEKKNVIIVQVSRRLLSL